MMDSTVVVAIIAGVLNVVGIVVSSVLSSQLVKYRLQELEKKVDKHNQVIERVYHLESDDRLIQERLDRLEEDVK